MRGYMINIVPSNFASLLSIVSSEFTSATTTNTSIDSSNAENKKQQQQPRCGIFFVSLSTFLSFNPLVFFFFSTVFFLDYSSVEFVFRSMRIEIILQSILMLELLLLHLSIVSFLFLALPRI